MGTLSYRREFSWKIPAIQQISRRLPGPPVTHRPYKWSQGRPSPSARKFYFDYRTLGPTPSPGCEPHG
ncbi:UNVERIFIED_CONTAM: hypothetical protein Sradi_3601700 [Sesamum radiatum]|uniref:Uncharacterized protein n=1 Tax=Sesamum radiatum TaxID=300843 RepID=A0AAW2QGW1_SESRA